MGIRAERRERRIAKEKEIATNAVDRFVGWFTGEKVTRDVPRLARGAVVNIIDAGAPQEKSVREAGVRKALAVIDELVADVRGRFEKGETVEAVCAAYEDPKRKKFVAGMREVMDLEESAKAAPQSKKSCGGRKWRYDKAKRSRHGGSKRRRWDKRRADETGHKVVSINNDKNVTTRRI